MGQSKSKMTRTASPPQVPPSAMKDQPSPKKQRDPTPFPDRVGWWYEAQAEKSHSKGMKQHGIDSSEAHSSDGKKRSKNEPNPPADSHHREHKSKAEHDPSILAENKSKNVSASKQKRAKRREHPEHGSPSSHRRHQDENSSPAYKRRVVSEEKEAITARNEHRRLSHDSSAQKHASAKCDPFYSCGDCEQCDSHMRRPVNRNSQHTYIAEARRRKADAQARADEFLDDLADEMKAEAREQAFQR